jgi:hypothetical protein
MDPTEELRLFAERESAASSCEASLPTQTADVRPAAPIEPCGPAVPLDDNTFLDPAGAPAPELSPRRLPTPITVHNLVVSASCPSPTLPSSTFDPVLPTGLSYNSGSHTLTAEAGFLELPVFLDAVTNTGTGAESIKLTDLYRLSARMEAISAFVDANLYAFYAVEDLEGFAQGLAVELMVSNAAAADVAQALFDTVTLLNTSALLQAQSLLPCVFLNDPFWVKCDSTNTAGYVVTYTDPEDLSYTAVPAGTTESLTSEQDAHNKALINTLLELACVVGNEAVTATCAEVSTEFAGVVEYPDEGGSVTLSSLHETTFATKSAGRDGDPTTPRTLIFTVTVPADTFVAQTREAANALAKASALGQLDCFIPSPTISRSCVNVNTSAAARAEVEGIGAEKALDEMATGYTTVSRSTVKPDNPGISVGFITLAPALRATSPAGFFTASTKTAAFDLAQAHALSLLDCVWTSPAYNCGCVGTDVPPGLGQIDFQFSATELSAERNARLNYLASTSSNSLTNGQFVTSEFPNAEITVGQAWTETLSAICFASLTCVFDACAIVCCAPQEDDRERMENGEINRFWLPSLGRATNAAARAAWVSGRTAPTGCSGTPAGCVENPEDPGCGDYTPGCESGASSIFGSWASSAPFYGTPARFRFGGTLPYGYVWKDADTWPRGPGGATVPISPQTCGTPNGYAGDPTKDHYSCVLGFAEAVGSFTGLYDQAKNEAAGRLQCDHIAWGRHLIKCPSQNERPRRVVNINERFVAPSTKLANMAHERALMALMQCEEIHPFKMSVANGTLTISRPSVNIVGGGGGGGGGGGLSCDVENAQRGLRPLKLYQNCTTEWPTDENGYYVGVTSDKHVFVEAKCCPSPVNAARWILHIVSSDDSYSDLYTNYGVMSDDAKAKQSAIETSTNVVWYVGSVAKADTVADSQEDEWLVHQNLNSALTFGASGSASICPFGATYASGTGLKLQGGVVGGGASVTVPDYVLYSSTAPADGTQVWLDATFVANSSGGILLPGGHVSAASIDKGSTIPSDSMPTPSVAGHIYVPLGDFMSGKFRPAGCGNIQISFCPSSLTYTRF